VAEAVWENLPAWAAVKLQQNEDYCGVQVHDADTDQLLGYVVCPINELPLRDNAVFNMRMIKWQTYPDKVECYMCKDSYLTCWLFISNEITPVCRGCLQGH